MRRGRERERPWRQGNTRPAQHPVGLKALLIRLLCRPGGIVIDLFVCGGTTALACLQAGRRFWGGDLMPDYIQIVRRRVMDASRYAPLRRPTAARLLGAFQRGISAVSDASRNWRPGSAGSESRGHRSLPDPAGSPVRVVAPAILT